MRVDHGRVMMVVVVVVTMAVIIVLIVLVIGRVDGLSKNHRLFYTDAGVCQRSERILSIDMHH